MYRKLDDSVPNLLAAMHNAGGAIALQLNQRKEALEYCLEFKRIQDEVFAVTGIATTKYAAAFTELGMAYLMNENATVEVFRLFEQSENIRRALPGYNKLNLFNVLRGKGYHFWLRTEFDEASKYLLEALHDRRARFGDEDRKRLRCVQPYVMHESSH